MNSIKKLLLTITALPFFLGLAQSSAHAQLLDLYAHMATMSSHGGLHQLQRESTAESLLNNMSFGFGVLSGYSQNPTTVIQISIPDSQTLITLDDAKTFDYAVPTAHEPDVYALILVGLVLIGFAASRRRTYYC